MLLVLVRVVVGYWLTRVVTVAVLLVVGLLIAGSSPPLTPSAATREAQTIRREQRAAEQTEEAARQASYAAHPGPPYPTASFTP